MEVDILPRLKNVDFLETVFVNYDGLRAELTEDFYIKEI